MKKSLIFAVIIGLVLAATTAGYSWKARTETDTAAGFCGTVSAADSAKVVGPLTGAAYRGESAVQTNTSAFSVAVTTTAVHSGDVLGTDFWVFLGMRNAAANWPANPVGANSLRPMFVSAVDTVEAGGRGFTISHQGCTSGDSIVIFWRLERLAD